ncbi:Nuclear nucleic acid-binding proteinD [Arachis hypogaea]|nr:Nuclear nucleic acid-binding proteinD [Arachis hypogaea]
MARGSESVGEGGTERDERSTEAHGSQPGESGSRAAEYSLSQTLSSSLKCLLFTRSLPLNPCQHHFHPFLICKGTNPDYHPLKSELDRLKVYQRKLEPFWDVGQELILVDLGFCLRSSTTSFFFLDDQASVDHSLRDLTSVQRKEMANMSIGEVPMMSNYQEQAGQKRKHPSSEEHPVQVYSEMMTSDDHFELLVQLCCPYFSESGTKIHLMLKLKNLNSELKYADSGEVSGYIQSRIALACNRQL